MIRKIISFSVLAIAAFALLLPGCAPAPSGQVVPALRASISDSSGRALTRSRAISPGDAVTTIDSYRVVFKKIEIGNSEADKYTLWENEAGEEKDIARAIAFAGVQPVAAGTYGFVRLTIGPVLTVAGSILDAGTAYSGTGSQTLDQTVYVWGSGPSGAAVLAAPITIIDGCSISFDFDIAGTVRYLGGNADAASIGVSKPNLAVRVE
jgi:hypothetical protein